MTQNDATQRQIEAADPSRSTWLSANAGSGKTRVLTDRVARLLLNGEKPENILCLTYTKAAASEMQNRLFQRLGEWAMMPADKLRQQLKDMGATTNVEPTYLADARKLFAAAIETPGGLKIQTIHSFCAGILRRFPLEASVSPQFKEMEDRAASLLRQDVLDDLATGPQAPIVAEFAQHYTGAEIDGLLAAITSKRAAFLSPIDEETLAQVFDLPKGLTAQAIIDAVATPDDLDTIKRLIPICLASGANDQKAAAKLQNIDCESPITFADIAIMEDVFLFGGTAKNPFGAKIDTFPVKGVRTANPDLIEELNDLMERVAEGRETRLSWLAQQKTRALYDFATPFVTAYEAKKAERAVLDFDDLINKAKALLENPAVAQWVLFRLDGGVDHILVDEAQDTSPTQWDIVRLLTQEFSTGLGANPDRERTVFVVGDKKQSIYSFQGADPEGFDRMKDHFKEELSKVSKVLQDLELLYSFRSSDAILGLVDQTFQGDMQDGLGARVEHLAFKTEMPGRVDLWPMIEPSEKPEERDWDDPIDLKGRTNNKVLLAEQIASEISRMIKHETLPVKGSNETEWSRRPITPGDVLILVQRRSDVFEEIIAACKKEGLEIAGADRLKLGGEIAVKDISALLQFLALQDDDLSLAAALKSPLFGWDEKQLFDLAQPRKKGVSLWQALRTSGHHEETLTVLHDLRNRSDFLRPYDLINRILIRHNGRKKLIARLGHEAEDGIDALLSQALGYEQTDIPSLTGFLTWLDTDDVTIKRQMDNAGDRIRVMTVHGAKGLEAPIVILPDTTKRERKLRGDLLTSEDGVFWKPKAAAMPQAMADIQNQMLDAQERERRRLLYVAMTRAENWLIVAAAGEDEKNDGSWHRTISDAMDHLDSVTHTAPFGPIKRFSRRDWDSGPLASTIAKEKASTPTVPFSSTVPEVPKAAQLLAPSSFEGSKILSGETHTESSDEALAWGRLVHYLLEVLPSLEKSQWRQTAARLVENQPDAGLIENPDSLIDEALATLSDDGLSWVWASGLAEVPISATLPALENERIFGIIDRLLVNDDDVIAVDFKTNRETPTSPEDTPIGLVRQMAAYRDGLKQIYPNHRIRMLLLWTKTNAMTEVPDAMLDAALKGVSLP